MATYNNEPVIEEFVYAQQVRPNVNGIFSQNYTIVSSVEANTVYTLKSIFLVSESGGLKIDVYRDRSDYVTDRTSVFTNISPSSLLEPSDVNIGSSIFTKASDGSSPAFGSSYVGDHEDQGSSLAGGTGAGFEGDRIYATFQADNVEGTEDCGFMLVFEKATYPYKQVV